jgi:putative endonuclease
MIQEEREYYIYILASKRNGTLYIGVTNDLKRRVYEHKEKIISGFTAKYNVDKLVYYEAFGDVGEAIYREKQLKKWNRNWKIELIEDFNACWSDLYDNI